MGLAAQLANTGWLGFVRVDYRNGSNIDGVTGNAGLRYQFTPETIAAMMPTKAPVKALGTVIRPTNWTVSTSAASLGGVGNNPRVLGGLGGFELGYNYQTANNWVFGVEGDIGATNMKGSWTCTTGVLFATSLVCQNSSNWMATVAGRVGYSWGRTLFYGKASGAVADDTVNVSCVFGPIGFCINQFGGVTHSFNSGGTRSGWLVGYGTEFDLGRNWSAKGGIRLHRSRQPRPLPATA